MPFSKRCPPEKRVYAKNLRRHPTRAETILWSYLRNNQLGFRFKRQELVLGWIADFYCPKAKIVIEIDGPGHDILRKADDWYRDQKMWDHGILTLRVNNRSVERTPKAVVGWIKDHTVIRQLKPGSSTQVHFVYDGVLKS
jgi:very-short-patch-repair endonuclease